jgi:hypothetical protein
MRGAESRVTVIRYNEWKMNKYGVCWRTVEDKELHLDGFAKVEFAPTEIVDILYQLARDKGYEMVWDKREPVWRKKKPATFEHSLEASRD